MITSDVGPWGIVPRSLLDDLAGNGTAIAVYALLSSHADRQHADDWIGSRTALAKECGISVATYKRAVRALIDAGWVTVEERWTDDGDRGWNRYIVHLVNRGRPENEPPSPQNRADVSREMSHVPQTPSSDPSTDPLRGGVEVLGFFDHFWNLYPRKVGKPAARKAWNAARKKAQEQSIVTGLNSWLEYWNGRQEPEFVPHPSTWLNQERWNDDPPPPSTPKRKTAPGMDRLREIWAEEQAKKQGSEAERGLP